MTGRSILQPQLVLSLVLWLAPPTAMAALAAAEPLVLRPDLRQEALFPHLEVLEDPARILALDDVRSSSFEEPGALVGIGHSSSAWWIRFSLRNPEASTMGAILEVGYPQLDEIVLYETTEHGDPVAIRMGDAQPYAERVLGLRNFVVPLSVNADQTATYYLRVTSTSVLAVPLRISATHSYYEHLQDDTLLLGAFYGVLLGLLLYNAFLFVSTRETIYLYYVAAGLFWGLYFAQLDGLTYRLWPTASGWQQYCVFVFGGLGIVFNAQFARRYLDTGTHARVSDRFLLAYIIGALLVVLASPFVGLWLLERLVGVLATATFAIVLAAFRRLRAGFRPALLYFAGWIGYLLCTMFSSLAAQGFLPYFLLAVLGVKVGFLLERVLSSLGLASRLKALQEQELELRRETLVARTQTQAETAERRRVEGVLQEREEQLLQAQKLEAVALLAGGVAHDFNNLLTVIRGYSQVLMEKLGKQATLHKAAEQILVTTDRAAALTRQLLAFSRREEARPTVLDLNAAVTKLENLLGRLIGEDIKMVVNLDQTIGPVNADPGQIDQIIANLVVNARDAMPQGGQLTLSTQALELAADGPAGDGGSTPGRYVVLRVTDSGCGMDKETQSRLFEPFFTTKDPGQGTGLGLSTVYGIVRQNGGQVRFESELGEGTSFEVQLPCSDLEAPKTAPVEAAVDPSLLLGSETILLVEDEAIIRTLVLARLEPMGYQILTASDGLEALQVATEWAGTIHLLLTDVVMPELNGPDLSKRLRQTYPEIKIVFMSAYSQRPGDASTPLPAHDGYIEKPFHLPELPRQIRQILNRRAPLSSAGR